MIGFDPFDCILDCCVKIIYDYFCCGYCRGRAPKSPAEEVKDGAIFGVVDATTF